MVTGYCTVDDVRRALQETLNEFDSGAWAADDQQVVVDAITSQTEWLEKTTKRHWYEPDGIDEDDHDIIPTSTNERDDEEDIPTSSAFVVDGDGPSPKTSQGSYAKVDLARRDAESVSALYVRTEDGTFEDWADSDDYTEGSWPPSGEDYYLRVNNGGWSRLYLDTENLYDEEENEWVLDSWANAVYLEWSYGHEGIPKNVRKAVALRAAAELLMDDEAALGIPENASLQSAESKKQAMENRADELLEVYL